MTGPTIPTTHATVVGIPKPMSRSEWEPTGAPSDGGFGFSRHDPVEIDPPISLSGGSGGGLGEGEKATLWLLAIIAVVHGAPIVALLWQIATQP